MLIDLTKKCLNLLKILIIVFIYWKSININLIKSIKQMNKYELIINLSWMKRISIKPYAYLAGYIEKEMEIYYLLI